MSGEVLDITQIDGSKITSGELKSIDLNATAARDGSVFTTEGTYITLSGGTNDANAGAMASKNFRLQSDGTLALQAVEGTGTGSGEGSIELNSSTQLITIKDEGNIRVKLGKLS